MYGDGGSIVMCGLGKFGCYTLVSLYELVNRYTVSVAFVSSVSADESVIIV